MTNKLENNLSKFSLDKRLSTFREKRKAEDYLMLTITVFALIFFGVFIIRPSINLIFELNQKSKEYKDLSIKLDEKIKKLDQIKAERESIKHELLLLEIAITEKPNESDILNNINYVASRNNIQLSDITFTFDQETATIKMNFKATGTYENTVTMLSDINNLLTPVNINSVSINPQKEFGNSIIELSIEAESYYLHQ